MIVGNKNFMRRLAAAEARLALENAPPSEGLRALLQHALLTYDRRQLVGWVPDEASSMAETGLGRLVREARQWPEGEPR
jgi:hypothetical protein